MLLVSCGRKIIGIDVEWNGTIMIANEDIHKCFDDGGEWMNISFQKLLMKMEDELRLAKTADTETAQRERIHSIKTLCELVLDEPVQQGAGATGYSSPGTGRNIVQPAPPQYVAAQPAFTQPQMPANQPSPMMPQPKKLEMEDDSNGDSLFDF
jgi:hypothetical protein